MKLTRKNLFLGVSAVFTVALTAPSAFAASQNWDGGSVTNGNWSNVDNWNGAIPGATSGTTSTDIATFNAAIANTWGNASGNPIMVDANRNIGGFNFTLAAGKFFIGSTAGNAVLLSSGGTTQVNSGLTANTGVYTINAPLSIQGTNGTYTFTNNSANGNVANGGTLTLGGAITGAAAGATVITLNGTNKNLIFSDNNNNITGSIGNGSATTLGITKDGAGTWFLSGANTYSGDTTITAGELRGVVLGPSLTPTSPFGTSTIKLNGGTLAVRAAGAADASVQTVTIGNNVVVGGNATVTANQPTGSSTNKTMAMGTLSIGTNTLGFTQGGSYKLSFTGTTLTGDAIFNPLTATTSELILGGVAESGGSRSLTKSGIGILTINATSTFSGDTNITAGILNLTHASALQNSAFDTASIVGGSAAGLRTSVTALTLGGLKGSNNFATRFTSTTGGYTGLTGLTLNPGTGVTHTYSGDIGNGNGSMTLTKTGLGTQVLTNTNTHSGATSVTTGTLEIAGTGSINNSTSLTVSSGATFRYNSSTTLSVSTITNSGTIAGSGNLAGITLGGTGSVDPGNSPGILTASATNPSGGLDYNFEMTAANTLPTWSNAAASVNDVLRLTGGTPFSSNLGVGNVISVYFGDGVTPSSGDVFTGGFFTDNDAAFLSAISSATFNYFVYNVSGGTSYNGSNYDIYSGSPINVGTVSVASADFAGGTVDGYVTQFTVVPEPNVAALFGSLGALILLRRRRS